MMTQSGQFQSLLLTLTGQSRWRRSDVCTMQALAQLVVKEKALWDASGGDLALYKWRLINLIKRNSTQHQTSITWWPGWTKGKCTVFNSQMQVAYWFSVIYWTCKNKTNNGSEAMRWRGIHKTPEGESSTQQVITVLTAWLGLEKSTVLNTRWFITAAAFQRNMWITTTTKPDAKQCFTDTDTELFRLLPLDATAPLVQRQERWSHDGYGSSSSMSLASKVNWGPAV